MPTESKSLTEQRIRKEKALAGLRELQLRQAEGKLLSAVEVERAWAAAVIKLRNAVLAVPSRCAAQFADPRHAGLEGRLPDSPTEPGVPIDLAVYRWQKQLSRLVSDSDRSVILEFAMDRNGPESVDVARVDFIVNLLYSDEVRFGQA